MTTSLVIRNSEGKVINIGEWDYMEETLEDGSVVQHNPYPDGATEAEEEIVTLDDGGLAAAEETTSG